MVEGTKKNQNQMDVGEKNQTKNCLIIFDNVRKQVDKLTIKPKKIFF